MYNNVRVIAVIIFFIICVIVFKRTSWFEGRKKITFSILFSILFFVISSLLPVEIFFVTFDSPVQAYQYVYPNNAVLDVVETEDCAYVISLGEGDEGFYFTGIRESKGEWNIPVPWSAFYNITGISFENDVFYGVSSSPFCDVDMVYVQLPVFSEDPQSFGVINSDGSEFDMLEFKLVINGSSSYKIYYDFVASDRERISFYINEELVAFTR